METILFVLANSAIAAVISSITAALVNKLQQDRGYKQDYYKEIILNYRKLLPRLDIQKIQDYALIAPKSNKVLEILQMEVL